MHNQISRYLNVNIYKDGSVNVHIGRFIHQGGRIVFKSLKSYDVTNGKTVERLNHVLDVYRGNGIRVGLNKKYTAINQYFDNVFMLNGMTLDRYKHVDIFWLLNEAREAGYYVRPDSKRV